MWQNTERKFAINLKKHKISTIKSLKNVTQQKKPGELPVAEQEKEPGTFITIRSNRKYHQPTTLLQ